MAAPKLVAFRHFVARVVFAVPRKSVRGSLVQGMAERRLVYAHLSCDVVPPAKLVGTADALEVEHEATNSASAVRNLTFASGPPSITKPVWCSWKHSRSMVLAPMASHYESVTSAVLTRSLSVCHTTLHMRVAERHLEVNGQTNARPCLQQKRDIKWAPPPRPQPELVTHELEGNCLLEHRATPAPAGCAIFQLHVGCTAHSPQRSRICHISRRPTGAQQSQSATSSHIGVIFVVRAPHADVDLKVMQDTMKPRNQIKHGTSQDWFIARFRLHLAFTAQAHVAPW